MELRDIVVTPLFIIGIFIIAYLVKGKVTDDVTARYYFPALIVKVLGALAVGFIYQFYYDGGDTYDYHTSGSRIVWEAIIDNPTEGVKLLINNVKEDPSLFKYGKRILFFRDPQSYFVVRISAFFDLFTFSTYSATAVLFSILAFSGAWALFLTFYRLYPNFHKWIAFSCLFIPSVSFWGSGIFKDTITMAGVCWLTYSFSRIAFEKKNIVLNIVIFLFSAWIIFSIKKYILLTFLPAIILWFFSARVGYIKSLIGKIIVFPLAALMVAIFGYLVMKKVGEDDERYDLSKLAYTAKITAYDIRYGWGARTGEGSGYTLGDLDGTWQTMLPLAPKAINVSLFRPYVWEIKNPLMALSAMESLGLLLITLFLFLKAKLRIFKALINPEVLFCLTFSLVFAFAVGVSTYNFGTLSRYKIPLMPFYVLAIGLIYNYITNKAKKIT